MFARTAAQECEEGSQCGIVLAKQELNQTCSVKQGLRTTRRVRTRRPGNSSLHGVTRETGAALSEHLGCDERGMSCLTGGRTVTASGSSDSPVSERTLARGDLKSDDGMVVSELFAATVAGSHVHDEQPHPGCTLLADNLSDAKQNLVHRG